MAKVIVIEGIDGSGKDTTAELLAKRYTEQGLKCSIINSLSGKILSPIIRNMLKKKNSNRKQLTALFIAELYEVEKELKRKLKTDDIVICNRWIYSTMAYNSESLAQMNAIMVLSATEVQPDFIFYLDLPVKDALARLNARDGILEIFENETKLTKVKENYDIISNIRSINNFYRVDAHMTTNDIVDHIVSIVTPEF